MHFHSKSMSRQLYLYFVLAIPFTLCRKIETNIKETLQQDVGSCVIPGCEDNYLLFPIGLPVIGSCLKTLPTEVTTVSLNMKAGTWFDAQSYCKASGYRSFDLKEDSVWVSLNLALGKLLCLSDRFWTGFHVLNQLLNNKTDVEVQSINRSPGYVSKADLKTIFNYGKFRRVSDTGVIQSCFQKWSAQRLDCQSCQLVTKSLCQAVYKA